LKSESDGIWQVKYEGTLFTAAKNLSATMLGSEDEYDEEDFV